MLQAFKAYIKFSGLFNQPDRILLAVSGGVDSIVMVQLFKDAGYNFGIAHVNFGLRGVESDGDEAFVKNLASKIDVPFYSKNFSTKQYAADHKVSIQMAARDLRYAWFDEIVKENGYSYVATAHHLDDQAETFFINLLRGTGISGMHGIMPKQGRIIRPMMFTTREKIMAFALDLHLAWRDDRSNKSRKYLRNKLRLDVLSELYKINPQFSYKLNESISHLREVESIYHSHIAGITADLVQHTAEGILISIDWVYEYEPHDTYLFELLKPYGFTFSVVKEIVHSLDTFSGKVFYSPTHRLLRDRENFIIQPLTELASEPTQTESYPLEKGITEFEKPINLCAYETDVVSDLPMGKSSVACLDLDKLIFPLQLRKWEKGDWFIPLGLKGSKKMSDFFIDQKFSLAEKEKTWLLISGNDIVWVIGKRIDNRYRITSKTKRAYILISADDIAEAEPSSGCCMLFG
ncbi:MAG: tRNA lysidine(34) synthetase TilS [Bacteroidales bacterium]|nr:tRNA lysidine(34) synthetase TilS [Bacteroidales bacterium]